MLGRLAQELTPPGTEGIVLTPPSRCWRRRRRSRGFIGICEVLGAVGLILPVLLNIRPAQTALAALGLDMIMIGATASTQAIGGGVMALPLTLGLLAAVVAFGLRPQTLRGAAHAQALQLAG